MRSDIHSGLDAVYPAILIAGPTASGKSRLALRLARAFGGAIINADSMQVYDALPVLTARPTEEDFAVVPHHLYGYVSALERSSAAAWLNACTDCLTRLRATRTLPVITGGSGFYFSALEGKLHAIPSMRAELRDDFYRSHLRTTTAELHARLAHCDPETSRRLSPDAPRRRLLRALEVFAATGRPLSEWHYGAPAFNLASHYHPIIRIMLAPPRRALHIKSASRFRIMINEGACDEVAALQQRIAAAMNSRNGVDPKTLPITQALGVTQISAWLEGKSSRTATFEAVEIALRRYIKRQMTWFNKHMTTGWTWFDPLHPDPGHIMTSVTRLIRLS